VLRVAALCVLDPSACITRGGEKKASSGASSKASARSASTSKKKQAVMAPVLGVAAM
jgi:hypothetical protein